MWRHCHPVDPEDIAKKFFELRCKSHTSLTCRPFGEELLGIVLFIKNTPKGPAQMV